MSINLGHWGFFCYIEPHFFIVCWNMPKFAILHKYVQKWGNLGYCDCPRPMSAVCSVLASKILPHGLYLSYFIIYLFRTFTTWKQCAALTLCITFHAHGMSDWRSFDCQSRSFFRDRDLGSPFGQKITGRMRLQSQKRDCNLFSFLFSNRPCYWFFKNLQINGKHVFC